ncbi:hypothetical protein [Pseudomonas aeruginosa]|uniref:hypothetical protein n=1 Tax=Pseudomonas aeruginosa TaxID=287 RepID=UPI001F35CC52|nr:hypothetical protein [Pseudomonas aeruginosa]
MEAFFGSDRLGQRRQQCEGTLLGLVQRRVVAGPADTAVAGVVGRADHQAQPVLIAVEGIVGKR